MAIVIALFAAFTGVAVALYAASRSKPDTFEISRARTIAAPPEKIFPFVNDFSLWHRWSPFDALDPAMQREISNPSAGVGATYAWSGNRKAGAGNMTIVESAPPRRVELDLVFTKPWKARNPTVFTFDPSSDGTRVVWSMSGDNTPMGKALSVFIDMDRMIGPDFEKGLAALERAAVEHAV